ncbi:poly-gamma-glutamate hydrolase family protein [Brucella pseudogrignonensis]|uniref:Phage replication-related protein YjqB (UPF0714/DUF867 family) n=1 Tax=Brucella pseudogrignonensis TaxID=419475 RepID=A0ABU1MD73_9HYPH|nr:poly-gamma-glutamate hydrolase family protein [Brucella pseudogrignonensis]MDR6434003.1 phage replication-related protein YjqB (UPF0714/DUF867 family) [Brucella pseudogrignonensis]
MSDRFHSFEELCDVFAEGTDFEVVTRFVPGSKIVIIAPHGGTIEYFTTELAYEIAVEHYSFYSFVGLMDRKHARDLHITSHRFFEVRMDDLLSHSRYALAIHGRKDMQKLASLGELDDKDAIYLGGLDTQFIQFLDDELRKSGFATRSSGHAFLASNQDNLCNRCQSGKGAQMELPLSLRHAFANSGTLKSQFVAATQKAIARRIGN